ncbi:MAG: hypothetical protein ABEJ74_01735 [Haloferacaceae archaeon]
MDRRQFLRLTVLGGLSSIAGCSESTRPVEELDSFATHNYHPVPAGECLIQPISSSYTAEIEYYVNVRRPDEGYSQSVPANALVLPEYVVPGEGTRELPREVLSGYLESPSRLDVLEDIDASGTVPPGWNTFVVDNSRGETAIQVETGGTLYRSKDPVGASSCDTTSEGKLSVQKLDFVRSYAGPPNRLLFHYRIDSPASDRYRWSVTVLTKTAQTTATWETESECAAHLAGDWEIADDALNGFRQSGDRLKVEITAIGESDEYRAEQWVDL